MKAILRSINNFSCKLKQSNNLKYNISPKIRSNKFKSISGNGNVVIEDALNKDLKDYKIYGNTYQNSTSGKNLLDISKIDKTTKNGVTCSYDPETQVVTLNGTCTVNNTSFSIAPRPNIPIKTSTTKLYVYCINGSVENYGIFRMYDADWAKNLNVNLIDFDANHKIIKKTAGSTFSAVNIGVRLNDGAVCNNFQFKVMVADSDDDTYEPYTNGPAPNPEFPIDMVSCGDRTKNLCFTNFDNWEIGQYSTDGNKNFASGRIRLKELLKIETGKQYYFNTFSEFKFILRTYDENKDFISSFGTIENGNTLTPQTAKYLGITIYNPNDSSLVYSDYETLFENGTIRPLICLNSETDKSYEPYGYKIPINVRSDNLFDINSNFKVNTLNEAGITSVFNADGTITVNGVKNNNNYKYIDYRIPLPAGTYYFSGCPSGGSKNGYSSLVQPISSDVSSQIFDIGNGNMFTLEKPTTIIYCPVRVATSSITFNNTVFKPMIAKIPLSYDDYQSYHNETTNIYLDEPLRKTKDGTYVDYIDFANQKVYRQLGEIKTTNYAQFNHNGNTQANVKFTSIVINNLKLNIPETGTSNRILFCNHILHLGGTTPSSRIRFNIPHEYLGTTSSSTAQEAKQALINLMSGKTMEFVYPLETPTEEDIELPNINLIEGKNIITIGTEVKGVFEVEYYSKEIIDISNYKYNLRKVED